MDRQAPSAIQSCLLPRACTVLPLGPAGKTQALPLRLWWPSPQPCPSGPRGGPLHSGSHWFPLHHGAAHEAMSKSRSWYCFRDGTHTAPRDPPRGACSHTEVCRRGGKAGGEQSPEAASAAALGPWPCRGQVSPFLPRSVTPGSRGWEKLCSWGRWPRGTKGLTRPCEGRKVCLGLVRPCPGLYQVAFP